MAQLTLCFSNIRAPPPHHQEHSVCIQCTSIILKLLWLLTNQAFCMLWRNSECTIAAHSQDNFIWIMQQQQCRALEGMRSLRKLVIPFLFSWRLCNINDHFTGWSLRASKGVIEFFQCACAVLVMFWTDVKFRKTKLEFVLFNFRLTYFLLRMVWNKEMLYRHCFSTLL